MRPSLPTSDHLETPASFFSHGDHAFILDAPHGRLHTRNAPYGWADGACLFGARPSKVVAVDSASRGADAVRRLDDFARWLEQSSCAIGVGFLSYGFGGLIEPAAASRRPPDPLPALYFAAYDEYYRYDPGSRALFRERRGQSPDPFAVPHWLQAGDFASSGGRALLGAGPRSNFTPLAYMRAVETAREYILAGDIFEVNLSQRFSAPFEGEPMLLYDRLRRANPAPYAAFLSGGDFALLSSSPELFLDVRGERILTRPIKGTARRSENEAEDARIAEALYSSEKENAELAMIVDLERNDLGRVCRYGSVRVVEPRRVETFAKVHHLVATVEGLLRPGAAVGDIVRATFPGGSVTGAPKIRAMQIIDELEPCARGIYTGAIGYILPGGRAEFNIVIRTVVCGGGQLHLQVGGAVTADSDPALEYLETINKAEAALDALWPGMRIDAAPAPKEA